MRLTKKPLFLMLAASLVVLPCTAQAYPRVFLTGITTAQPVEVQPGYVLSNDIRPYFNDIDVNNRAGGPNAPKYPNPALLLDMNGKVAHQWNLSGYQPMRVRLLPNGNLAFINLSKPYALAPQVSEANKKPTNEDFVAGMVELDWNGKEVARFNSFMGYHHDFRKLENGNYLLLGADMMPPEYQAKVKNPDLPWWPGYERTKIAQGGDIIQEVTPSGDVVWEWKAWEHLGVNSFSPLNASVDWTHGNTVDVLPPNPFFDKGDQRFKPGNIIFNPRNLDMVCIIDRESKEIVWSYTGTYKGGLAHAHDTTMIASGLPGNGNVLIFDNGLFPKHRDHSGQSYILEVNPSTGDVEWKYETVGYSNMRFFSKTNGATQKLPNGNVFISEDNTGRMFQVKPDPKHPDGGEIVWEYLHHGSSIFSTFYPLNYCPQFSTLPQNPILAVSPVNPSQIQLLPDAERKNGNIVQYLPHN